LAEALFVFDQLSFDLGEFGFEGGKFVAHRLIVGGVHMFPFMSGQSAITG
jgi:hypothetical protein